MFRVVAFALVELAAWLVLRSLWPSIRGPGWRRNVVVIGSALALLAWILPALVGRGIHGEVPVFGLPFKLFAAVWLSASVLVLLGGAAWLAVGAVARGIRWISKKSGRSKNNELDSETEVDMARRSVLGRIGRALPVAAMATSLGGIANGERDFVVRRVRVKIPALPPALDGFRIGQITDLHVGAFITPEYLRRAVEAMNAEGTHLQVMTGDLIDDYTQLDATFEALAATTAPHGMLGIFGNHEHWRGTAPIIEKFSQFASRGAKLKLLVDEALVIEHEGARLRVVGVDYPFTRNVSESRDELMRRSAERSFVGIRPDETVLCLSHHPEFFPFAAERGAALTLSGHTHGGQVAVLGMPVFFFAFKHMLGRYRQERSQLYVSGGTGHWLPLRIGVPKEVTIVTLERA